MYVNLHVLSFKFATKVKMKGEQLGKKMLKPEKEDRKKGKCILNNFINEVKKDLFRQLFIQNSCFYQ